MGTIKDKDGRVIVEFSSKETNKEKPYDLKAMIYGNQNNNNKEKSKQDDES